MTGQAPTVATQKFRELLDECARLHGHICPGQLLGVRMALLGCALLNLEDPKEKNKKRLIVWVEIDRCMADALTVVTGASLGKRTLKYVDYGKVASTFYDTLRGEAVRILALDSARVLADKLYPQFEKKDRQMHAYAEVSDAELFKTEWVKPILSDNDMPGRPRSRVFCTCCGEGINDGRELEVQGRLLCRPCAHGSYYRL